MNKERAEVTIPLGSNSGSLPRDNLGTGMTAVNWARGSFRIWLIVSITWLVVVCAVGQIWHPVGGLIDLYTPAPWSDDPIVSTPAPPDLLAEEPPPWVEYQLQQDALKAANWRWLATISGFGVAPPLALLLLGLSAFGSHAVFGKANRRHRCCHTCSRRPLVRPRFGPRRSPFAPPIAATRHRISYG